MPFHGNSYFPIIRCPPTWDGWQCWENGGHPGHIEYMECPDYIYFESANLEAIQNEESIETTGSCRGKNIFAQRCIELNYHLINSSYCIIFLAIVHTEYAEKECTCDGTWYQKPPTISSKSITPTIVPNNTNSMGSDLKAIPVAVKRRGVEWTNYKTCR